MIVGNRVIKEGKGRKMKRVRMIESEKNFKEIVEIKESWEK